MRRVLLAAVAAAFVLAGSAQADTFTVLQGVQQLPSAEVPNGAVDVVIPAEISTPPAEPQVLTYAELLALWRQAGDTYGVPWELLAAINQVESGFGSNMGPSYAGAVGWMQFMPSTWERWGVDATGDGVADPWNATDAVFSAARYLAASGVAEDLPGAVWSYNHSQEYVDMVLGLAAQFLMNPLRGQAEMLAPAGTTADTTSLEERLVEAEQRVADLSATTAAIEDTLEASERTLLEAELATGDATLNDAGFAEARAQVEAVTADQSGMRGALDQTRLDLMQAQQDVAALEEAIATEHATISVNGLVGLIGTPPTPQASATIDWAVRQLGTPYQWGGNHGAGLEQMMTTDPAITNGFDCSSLIAWSYAKGAGIYIGDYTGTQWEYGLTAPGATRGFGEAQGGGPPPGGYMPGDVIFFNLTNHVGMYLGNDLFIHAPHTGDVVRVARLSDYSLKPYGWVRYEQVSGLVFGGTPSSVERVFQVVEAPAEESGDVVTFTQA